MFTVTFVRHGETKMNAAQIVQSRTPGELTERGVKMAESLGKHISNEKFTRVYSSDLTRCHDTTLTILKQSLSEQPEIILDPVLRERDYGDLEFKPLSAIDEIHKEVGGRVHTIPLPGGESYDDTMKRTSRFLSGLCKLADATKSPENVLVVTHGCWLMCLLDFLAANQNTYELVNCDEEKRMSSPMNTSTTKVTIHKKDADGNMDEKRKIEFHRIHDITHLLAAKIVTVES